MGSLTLTRVKFMVLLISLGLAKGFALRFRMETSRNTR